MVYIDAPVDRGWELGANAHMIADSVDELHVFADRLGMRRWWFQSGAHSSWPHYDLTIKRARKAMLLGAVQLERVAFVLKIRELRKGQANDNNLRG